MDREEQTKKMNVFENESHPFMNFVVRNFTVIIP